jgi:chaperonin GroES
MKIKAIIENATNIAEHLDEDTLTKIGEEVVEGYDADLQSRAGWERDVKKYLELAMQITREKTFPWAGAANVKYPIISTAAMQFAARAYPTLVPSNGNLVNIVVPTAPYAAPMQQRALNVSTYMSFQLLYEMPDWEDSMDNLLMILPIFGVGIKKIYYSPDCGTNCSELINPFNFVVNYWTDSLETCPRATHVLYRDAHWIEEKMRAKVYCKVDLGSPSVEDNKKEAINVSKNLSPSSEEDYTTPYTLLEQHMYYDLDEDGYREPYIALVDYKTRKVLRLTPRFDENSITFNEEQIVKIEPDCYFVKYTFFPSPDGSFYTRGFGHMLGPINEAIDSLLNQLIDAGTMSNLQSGFLGKGLKIRQGDKHFRPGEWKEVNNVGSDLKANIFPLPVREPSNVLFQLLGLLNTSAKELASVAEIFVGKMPGQNTPAHTTQQTIEQGMKLFTAIYKRVYRSLTKEFRLLYKLNSKYLDEASYQKVLSTPTATKADFNESDRFVFPTADPMASSDFEKQQKFQQIGSLIQMLKGLGLDDDTVKELTQGAPAFQPQQPKPDPEMVKAQAAAQLNQVQAQSTMAITQQKVQTEQQKAALKQKEAEYKMAMDQMQKTNDIKLGNAQQLMQMQLDASKAGLDMQQQTQQHALDMLQSQQKHQQAVTQTNQMAKVKQANARQPKTKE